MFDVPLDELRTRTSIKWTAHPADVLPLWVAEMDVHVAEPVREALIDTLRRGDTGYPGGDVYARALRGFAARRWAWDIAVERTAIVPDVMLGIVEVLRLVTTPGDAVVVNSPVYPPFFAFVTHADREIVDAPLGEDGRLDLAALDDAFVRARTGGRGVAYLLCNPHNPTGVAHTRDELTAVAALARRYGVRVIADEIHAPLVLGDASFTPYLSVSGAEDAFALMSASKGWNLAGLKAALVIAGAEAAADLRRMPEEVSHGPSHLGIIAHAAAYSAGGAWLDDLLAALTANRELLTRLVAEHLPGVTFRRPDATYLAWLDCGDVGGEAPAPTDGVRIVTELAGPARFFLDRARVAVSSGHTFGPSATSHVRLNFATSPAILTEAVTRMSSAL